MKQKLIHILLVFLIISFSSCMVSVQKQTDVKDQLFDEGGGLCVMSEVDSLYMNSTDMFSIAESYADYYSLHNEKVTIGYKDQSGIVQTEVKTGFKNIYNLNDPKILCNAESCTSTKEIISLPTGNLGSLGAYAPISKSTRFRMFMPAGTVQFTMILYMQQGPLVGAVARFGELPDCLSCNTNFRSINFTQEGSFLFEKLNDEVYLQNAGGHITLYSSALYPPDSSGINPPLTEGKWLYVYVFEGANAISIIDYGIKVNKNAYLKWYNAYDWTEDKSGLNVGSTNVPPSFSVSLKTDKIADESPLDVKFTSTVANGTPPYTYSWDFGDDTADIVIYDPPEPYTQSNSYSTIGNYTVSLTVTDSANNIATSSLNIYPCN